MTLVGPVLRSLAPGGPSVVDDLLPGPAWNAGQGERIVTLIATLAVRTGHHVARPLMASDVIVVTKTAG